MKETILVTGATGLLGAHLLFKLTENGGAVRAVYRKGSDRGQVLKIFSYYSKNAASQYQRINWVEADLMDIPALGDAMAGIEGVYHCAAMVSFDPRDADRLIETNPTITANVVNACLDKGIRKLVHVSSVAALSRQNQDGTIDETTQWVEGKHNSAYAKSKYLAELEVWRATEEGLKAVIVNPSIILGPGKWEEGSGALFKRMAGNFPFYTTGINAYVDVRDVAKAMEELMASGISGERFVVVAENASYKQVFQTIAEKLGAKKPSVKARPWQGELVWRLEMLKARLWGNKPLVTRETTRTARQRNVYSNAKIKRRLGFEFRGLEESIEDISKFYLMDNGR